jgi:hypothetical protein
MTRTRFVRGTIAVVTLLLTTATVASATIPVEVQACRRGVAGFSASLVQRALKTIQSCNDKALQSPGGGCVPPAPASTIAALEKALREGITRTCGTLPDNLLGAGYLNYPGPCSDPTPGNGFTQSDLYTCLVSSHEDAVNRLIDIQYNTTQVLDRPTLNCQKALSKHAGKFALAKLKAIQKCRNAIDRGTLNILPETCATGDPPTAAKIAKAEMRIHTGILVRCTPDAVQTLGICANPACASFCSGMCDADCVVACLIDSHGNEMCNADATATDLIDFQYPPPPPPPSCGNGIRDQLEEECDGSDDVRCPTLCGTSNSDFPCLCLDKPRERVIEHIDTDLDTGWTGLAHDSTIVEGGGYMLDLYDCDGPQGPDTLCTVGPSCSGGSHPPCSRNTDCSALGFGICRKEVTAVGPHCNFNVQQSCSCNLNSTTAQPVCLDETNCPGIGNFCIQHFHTPPLPLSAGGIPVCVVNVFTDNVTGTKDMTTGSSAIRLRQKSIVQLTGTQSQPCPVCGDFCKASPGDLGGRHHCSTNADCADTTLGVCVTDRVCSFGPNQDKACRPDPPFGGPTPVFGNTSIDCPPTLSSPGILDIVFDPATTDTVSLQPSFQCNEPAFSGKTCIGGTNEGADCPTGSECPGGTCSHQCFCPSIGGVRQQPNECGAACVGGPFDANPCAFDSECPEGFCHLADCRPDPSAPASLQPNEGGCTVTVEGQCSVSSYRSCFGDADCRSPTCLTCHPNEVCQIKPKDCYVNSGITRVGVASTTDPVQSAIFCIPATGQPAVDSTAGLPGPGTIRESTTVIDTGF